MHFKLNEKFLNSFVEVILVKKKLGRLTFEDDLRSGGLHSKPVSALGWQYGHSADRQ